MSESFTKFDTDKDCIPHLIPLNFRMGVNDYKGDDCWLESIIEHYESMSGHSDCRGLVIQAAALLKKDYEDNTGNSFWYGVGQVMTLGAKKYSPNNWKKCPYDERWRYIDAFYRHWWKSYEVFFDEESGLHHHLHAGCCLLMLHGITEIHWDKEHASCS